jgi:DNA invertase Pin-like site-specific DNA recombinase
MIAMVDSEDRPTDIVLVHSLSRGFRNALDFMQYRERLKRRGVKILSITHNFGDDRASEMVAAMLAIFDEYYSAGNPK